jgi:hypothetical protein
VFTARYELNLSINRLRFVLTVLRLGLRSSTSTVKFSLLFLLSRRYSMQSAGGNAEKGNELPGTLPFCGVIITIDS